MIDSESDRQAVIDACDRQAVDDRQRAVRVSRRPLETFLRRVQKELGLGEASVAICLVSDAEIARMNKKYRKKRGPTDVLSFPAIAKRARGSLRATSKKRKEGKFLGDIAIAPATARRYARKNGRTLPSELRVLILHGVLHLIGYDHETDRGQMDRVEQKLRKRFGLA